MEICLICDIINLYAQNSFAKNLRKRIQIMKQQHPDRQECLRILEEYKTPAHVVRHCMAVADTAVKIAAALNQHGYQLDLELIEAAGSLHDIARKEEEHWNRGAEIAESLGFFKEADIIRVHMHYSPFSPVEKITETDMVCLGDRTVKEDAYVGLDKRMEYILEKAKKGGRPNSIERILEKKEETRGFIRGIEAIIGTTLDQLMKGE